MAESTATETTIEAVDAITALTDTEQEQLSRFLSKHCPSIEEAGAKPYVFANDTSNPAPFAILDMIYKGVYTNTLGIMIAKHKESGVELPVLVGIAGVQGEDMTLFPVAVAINQENAEQFLAPDGAGGYVR